MNLGSGNEPLPGYLNVDQRTCPGVDLVADVRRLPFADGAVDELMASSLLEHFADPYAVLDEMHRVLHSQARAVVRVPSPFAFIAGMDPTHVFLADLKLWRQILGAYFRRVRVNPEGVRYRDNRLLAAITHFAVRVLRFYDFAQTWRFECAGKQAAPTRAYLPWWLEPGASLPGGSRRGSDRDA